MVCRQPALTRSFRRVPHEVGRWKPSIPGGGMPAKALDPPVCRTIPGATRRGRFSNQYRRSSVPYSISPPRRYFQLSPFPAGYLIPPMALNRCRSDTCFVSTLPLGWPLLQRMIHTAVQVRSDTCIFCFVHKFVVIRSTCVSCGGCPSLQEMHTAEDSTAVVIHVACESPV